MTGGEKLLVAGAVGLGVVAFLKYRSSATSTTSSLPPNLSGPQTLNATFADLGPGAPPLAPIYAIAKPLAPVIQSGVAKINSAIGGYNPYGALTRNPDGSYSDGSGCKITFLPNGTMHRDCGSIGNQFTHSNTYAAGKAVISVGKSGVKAVGHALSSAYNNTLGKIF